MFEYIILKDEALQSDTFGVEYQKFLANDNAPTFNSPLFEEINSALNLILSKYELSVFQKDILYKIFESFNNIRLQIDPQRLRPFDCNLNDDGDLLLYRNTEKGLTNIIIHSDESLAYSFIGKLENGRKLSFYGLDTDFEALAYKFFSN